MSETDSPATADSEPEITEDVDDPLLEVESGVWPETCVYRDQWLTWKMEGGDGEKKGRKIPRAPHANEGWTDKYVNAHKEKNWTDFETAKLWAEKLPGHRIAYDIADREDHPEEDLLLIDYDDVRDPETGAIHATVREHITRAGSYASVSSSGTGIHIIGWLPEGFPDGISAIESPLDLQGEKDDETELSDVDDRFPNAEIEAYCTKRFIGLTGEHLTATPTDVGDVEEFVEELCEIYATVSSSSKSGGQPAQSRTEIRDIKQTTDFSDITDAIYHTSPSDIRLDSTVTNERHDSKDLDPSWANSESGTRLAQDSEGWVYRQGMHSLDALQVVALEEGIIHDVTDYPSGSEFFDALEKLRERGAHIPYLVSEDAADESVSAVEFGGPDVDSDEVVLALAGKLQFESTRRDYTCQCPGCETGLAVDGDHDTPCDMGAVDMEQIIEAYRDLLSALDREAQSRARLRSEVASWGPVHERVLEYLCDEGTVAPRGDNA